MCLALSCLWGHSLTGVGWLHVPSSAAAAGPCFAVQLLRYSTEGNLEFEQGCDTLLDNWEECGTSVSQTTVAGALCCLAAAPWSASCATGGICWRQCLLHFAGAGTAQQHCPTCSPFLAGACSDILRADPCLCRVLDSVDAAGAQGPWAAAVQPLQARPALLAWAGIIAVLCWLARSMLLDAPICLH